MASSLIPIKLVFFLFFVSNSPVFSSSSSINSSMEAETLLKWKASLDNNSQALLSSLWVGSNHCNWTGITCDNTTGSVTNITLVDHGLRGTLKSLNFFYLPNLITLMLRNNLLYGSIPSHIGNLSKLKTTDLSYNDLSGNIPPEFGLLKSLVGFSLQGNSHSGHIPSYIGKFSKLTYINLRFNNFSGKIPSGIWLLQSLQYLLLDGNSIGGPIPSEIGLLKRVQYIFLGGNNISGPIPSEIGLLKSVEYLSLGGNNMSGPLPPEIGMLKTLDTLILANNSISGPIPASIGNLTSLSRLLLSGNALSGSLPPEIGMLKPLDTLSLSENSISGPIPASIGNLTSLSRLFLDRNQLSGPLPTSMGDLVSLKYLVLGSNHFSHSIPQNLASLQHIQQLDLSSNSLSGALHVEIGNWSNATYVDLSGNHFSGAIPDRVCDRKNDLKYLALNDNQLERQLPRSLINCSELVILNVADNKFSDTFPHWIGLLPNLRALILKSNRFHGSIQNSIPESSFSKLQMLDLSHNDFTGLLPTKLFQNLMALEEVAEFGKNDSYQYSVNLTIKGLERKYTVTVRKPIFSSVDLSMNGFRGEIPEVVGELRLLLALNLSHNSLNGSIPASFGKLAEVESLDLSFNNLSGRIPPQLTNLTFLAVLRFSNNNLVGPIPRGKQFETFDNDSYSGNLGLCGFPLSKECSNDERPEEPAQDEDGNGNGMAFIWKVAMMGYGCGMILGISMAYIVFTTGRPWWIVRMVERDLQNYITSWIQKKRNKLELHRDYVSLK